MLVKISHFTDDSKSFHRLFDILVAGTDLPLWTIFDMCQSASFIFSDMFDDFSDLFVFKDIATCPCCTDIVRTVGQVQFVD